MLAVKCLGESGSLQLDEIVLIRLTANTVVVAATAAVKAVIAEAVEINERFEDSFFE